MDTHLGTQLERASDEKPGESIFQKGSTQVVIMAGVVTTVSQPFAQSGIQELLGLSQLFPVIVAGVVSALLAAYQVFAVQRAKPFEGLVLAPLVALIVFSSYAGTNQLLANDPPAPAAVVSKTDLERMRNLEAQIKIQKELNAQLIKAAGLAAAENPQAASQHAPQTRNVLMDTIDNALGFFVTPAYGQDDKQRRIQEGEKRRLEAQLREARQKQENLEKEQRRLEQASHNAPARKAPLLKSW